MSLLDNTTAGVDAVNSMPVKPETILLIVGVCLFAIFAITGALWLWAKFSR